MAFHCFGGFFTVLLLIKKKIKDLIHGTKHNAMLTPLTSMYPCYWEVGIVASRSLYNWVFGFHILLFLGQDNGGGLHVG